ncbi:MAG: large-conductance mechanosensitive channel protein MscL [Planctomycetaceae bacterium]
MGIISEFKQFVQRGNVVDLAVGVIMGAAFGKIVNSLVTDILTPPIGFLTGGVKFSELSYKFPPKKISVPDVKNPTEMVELVIDPPAIDYGKFLQATFDFLIIAFCVFMLVKAMNYMQRKKDAAPPEPTLTEKLLTEIRDELKAK